jgi:hypothetical protein
MDRVKRGRIPLAALALVAPLMLSSSTTGSSAEGEVGTAPLTCEAPPAGLDHRIGTGVARIAGSGVPADGDFVVLNGRGFNYGHAEPGELDRIQLEALVKSRQAGTGRR